MSQIEWDNRLINDIGNDCLASVDGTDFLFMGRKLKNGKPDKEYYSHKFKTLALRYEIGIAIRSSKIVWIAGPYKPGIYNDIEIFRRPLGLKSMLENGERVEADDGYMGECPLHCKCPGSDTSHKNQKKMRARVRMRHEHVNERMKNYNCLNVKFRHGATRHGLAVRAIAVLVQLSMDLGEPLMDLDDYDDRMTDQEVKAIFNL